MSKHQILADGLTEHDLRNGLGTPTQQAAWQEAEWRRCAASPIYFLSHYGWIILKDGRLERWKLWDVQIMLLKEWMLHISTCAIKARQLGITTLSAHFALWEIIFKEAAKWTLFSSSEDKAKDIISRVQATKDRLPKWMVERAQNRNASFTGITKRQDKSDAVTRISFGLSEMKIMTSTPKSVQGSIGNFILDEFTLHTEQKRKFQMMLPAMDGGGMGIIIANGNGEDEFYRIYQRAKKGLNGFKAHFFTWRDDPTHDDAWYAEAEQKFLVDPRNADFDLSVFRSMYPETEDEAFFLSANSRFKVDLLNARLEEVRSAEELRPSDTGLVDWVDGRVKFTKNNKGKLRIFEHPKPGESYAVGIDPSGGTAFGDYSVIQVGRIENEKKVVQVAVFRARTEPGLLAYEAEKIARYYNEAYINVEANNHGGTVLERLKPIYSNLYMRKRSNKITTQGTDLVGYWMDGNSKQYLIDQLAEWIHMGYLVINDSETIKELIRYEVKENQTTAAAPGGHDDLVLALGHMVESAVDSVGSFVQEAPRILMPWEA